MVDLFPRRPKDPDAKPTSSVRSILSGHLSGSEQGKVVIEEKPLADPESGQKKNGIFSRPWTRRDLTILGSLSVLALTLVALIIALPVVFVHREHHGDSRTPYRSKHDDPSYKIKENKPIWALHDFPDPGLLEYNGTWYAFGTNPHKNDPTSIHIPVATSTNFVNWTLHDGWDAMPTIGNWERKVNHWAPDVIQRVGEFSHYL